MDVHKHLLYEGGVDAYNENKKDGLDKENDDGDEDGEGGGAKEERGDVVKVLKGEEKEMVNVAVIVIVKEVDSANMMNNKNDTNHYDNTEAVIESICMIVCINDTVNSDYLHIIMVSMNTVTLSYNELINVK